MNVTHVLIWYEHAYYFHITNANWQQWELSRWTHRTHRDDKPAIVEVDSGLALFAMSPVFPQPTE